MPATEVSASNGALPITQPLKLKPALNGHTPNGTSDRLQIIDNEKQFTFVYVQQVVCCLVLRAFRRSSLNDQLSAWSLRDVGFNYNLVAVFGSQSTGKSTPFSNTSSSNVLTLMQVPSSTGYSAPTSTSWMRRSGNRRRRVSISGVTPPSRPPPHWSCLMDCSDS
jgi:hypothetical protein